MGLVHLGLSQMCPAEGFQRADALSETQVRNALRVAISRAVRVSGASLPFDHPDKAGAAHGGAINQIKATQDS